MTIDCRAVIKYYIYQKLFKLDATLTDWIMVELEIVNEPLQTLILQRYFTKRRFQFV